MGPYVKWIKKKIWKSGLWLNLNGIDEEVSDTDSDEPLVVNVMKQ